MNVQQLKKQLGTALKLRPLPLRKDVSGEDRGSLDDDWILERIKDKPKAVVLDNTATGHFVELQGDNIREFRSPHYLVLRCLLVIQGREITIEPLVGP